MKTTGKLKKCQVCRAPFRPFRSFETWCSHEHGAIVALARLEKQKKAEAIKQAKADQAQRQAQKSTGLLIREAQTAFNEFIRLRDAGLPCICCGKPMLPQRPGGSVDAGHYRSRGSAPHLRFDERNCHAQRKSCNRPGGTTHGSFRAGMLRRIGLAELEALEADQTPRHYSPDELVALKKHYQAKTRELKKARAR